MATRRRSIVLGVIALCLGLAIYAYDDLFDHLELRSSPLHRLATVCEFLIMVPGLAVLAFAVSEYLRLARDEVERERRNAREERFAALGRVAASVAHEVRNPLHNIHLIIDEVRQGGGFGVHEPLCQRMQANLERINRAVDLVYELAKPAGGEARAEHPVELARVIGEAVEAERQRSGASIAWTAPSGSCQVGMQAQALRMVLDNLLRNASASDPSGVRVSLERRERAWEIEVANAGNLPPGLAGEAETAPIASSKLEGLGLGIFISRHIAQGAGAVLGLTQDGPLVRARLRVPAWKDDP